MVFLGLGILVVSLSFLLYKNRSLSYSDLVTPWRRKQGIEDQTRGEQQTEEVTSQREKIEEKDAANGFSSTRSDGLHDDTDDEAASPQTTPKATPITTTDSAPIPSFTLNDADSPTSAIPLSTTSSIPITNPSQHESTNPRLKQTHHQPTTHSMPPPPRPTTTSKRKQPAATPSQTPPPPHPTTTTNSNPSRPIPTTTTTLRPRPSPASTLRAPRTTLAPTTSTLPPSSRPPRRVLLAPNHSPLDWAHLLTHPPTPTFFRGASLPPHLIRVPPSLLRQHNGRGGRDAWATWQGRVYNVTPYLGFHPGGEAELMRGVGREGVAERLFLETHSWVSWEGMLGECLVGVMVGEGEGEGEGEGGLEEMD